METIRKLIAFIPGPYKKWVLIAMILVAAAIPLVLWLRSRKKGGATTVPGSPPSLSRNRLRQIHERFLAGLPWRQRAAVKDLPGAVVLGPAGAGKSKLVELDVDWQRQARQFLPSYTSDSLLQIYLGPDTVVQEISAPLLEDDTPQARLALRRLWKETFGQQQALAILVLDARWLAETPPDEVRRTAQLLRGKLNLLAEIRRGQVEARLCLTRMDELEGFEDFANLLRAHRVPLSFELPPRGEEGKLASLLQTQEQYLALGLTSLPVESFERLERFYSQGHRPFEALARFVTALLEGGTLAFAPRLSRVYLSSLLPSARAAGVLSVSAEANDAQAVRQRYLRNHLKRSVMLAVACSVPIVAAYAHFSWRLSQTEERVKRFEDTVQRMRNQGQEVSGTVVQEQVLAAGQSMDVLWRAMSYWPLLPYSFTGEREGLSLRLARGIREAHLRPALERCHKQPDTCRPEQVVFMLAALHASRDEALGQFVLSSLRSRSSLGFVQQEGAAPTPEADSLEAKRSWVTSVNLLDSLVGDYVLISDKPWQAPSTTEATWAHWPFREPLTLEAQLEPWQAHLKRLQELLHDQSLEPYELERLDAELESLQDERRRLQAQLDDSALLSTLPRVVDLLSASEARVDMSRFKGLPSTIKAVEWMNRNREVLSAVLRMEEEAYLGVKAVQKMTVAELLVREGLWLQGPGNPTFQVAVLQSTFAFRPRDSAQQLHQALLRYYEKTSRMPFGGVSGEEAARRGASASSVAAERVEFDTRLRPLVDEFTQRLKSAGLPLEQASQRQEHVQRKVNQFAIQYRQRLFQRVASYHFNAPMPAMLPEELSRLTQPSSELVDMLRDVAHGATLEPLEGPYYESLRNAVAPFKPVVQVMKPDESGNYAALSPYRTLVAQLVAELNAVPKASAAAAGKEPEKETGGAARLAEMLTPLGRIALSMMLEEEGSYLHKVNAWLDQQGLIGELRQPFLQPFLTARELGQQELEQKLGRQWEEIWGRMLKPLLTRYPFDPAATQEVDAGDLEVLRRQDGAFWDFVNRVLTPVCEERGSEWVLRGALKDRLTLPEELLSSLGGLSRLSRLLWDAEGKPRPLMLQVMPLPLPAAPTPGSFVTLGSLKCGKTTVLAYNQSPSWQEFPVAWWDQQTASLMLELRSPEQGAVQYTSLEKSRSAWGCFRLLEASTPTGDQHRQWSLRGRNAKDSNHLLEIRFGLKGEPWVPFREVPR